MKFKIISIGGLQNAIDNYIHSIIEFSGFVLVIKDGSVVAQKGYGMADRADSKSIHLQTKFQIGSLTKQFTATAIMMLYQQNLLDIDQHIDFYFPLFPRGDEITIKHLLQHTSGVHHIGDSSEFPFPYYNWTEAETLDKVIGFLEKVGLDFDPGTQYRYSCSGYILLAKIIECVSETDFSSFLQENIFTPLKMNNTGSFTYTENDSAIGYQLSKNGPIPSERVHADRIIGAGNLYSCAQDLALWNQELTAILNNPLHQGLLKRETLDSMLIPSKMPVFGFKDHRTSDYGYGWIINDTGNRIHHLGESCGFQACFSKYISENVSIIILSNTIGGNFELYIENIEGLALAKSF